MFKKEKTDIPIIIVCEDTYGLDVLAIVEAINHSNGLNRYSVLGFICDNIKAFDDMDLPVYLLGKISEWVCSGKERYVMAIRNPLHKQKAAELLKRKGAVFETLIAPWVHTPPEFTAGEGCIIGNYLFKNKSVFGKFVIMDNIICESVEIGDYSTLCPFVNITSSNIGQRVYIGTHSAIVSGRIVGDDAYILPGSIVMGNVKPGSRIAGIPASSRNAKIWEDQKNE